jgi:dolichyl-diphosphooligosaccharide--protein glycosyltransferase
MTFMSILPIIASAIALIGIYLVSREITGSDVASIIALSFAATFFLDRTVAGFIVKYTIAIMGTPIAIYLFIRSLKTLDRKYFILTGLLIAYLAYSTGLYVAVYVPIYATILLLPLIIKRIEDLNKLILDTVYMSIPVIIVFLGTPIYGLSYILKNLGIVPLAVIFMLVIYRALYIPYLKKRALGIYILTIFGVAVLGLLAINYGLLGLSGKAAQALGLFHVLGTLSFTIAEYQPTNLGYVVNIYGSVLILSIFSMLYNIYLIISRRDLVAFLLTLLGVIMLYVLINLSYFLSLSVIVMSMLSASFIGQLVRVSAPIFTRVRRYFSFSALISVILLVAILISHVYIVYSYHIPAYRSHLPMIVTSGISMTLPSDSWIRALERMRNKTDPESVIVAWWDYGYWITPLGQRASIADGSTINGTQIELLAKLLTTTNESIAVDILTRDFKLKPNKTYILVYDAFVINRYGEYVFPLNWADAAKGISAVFRIAGVNIDYDIYGNNTPSIYTVGSGPQKYVRVIKNYYTGQIRIVPNWASDEVRNTLLYGIMIDGVTKLFPGYTFYSDDPQAGGVAVEPPKFQHFKLAAIFPSYIPLFGNSPNSFYEAYVIVFVYQFIG